MAAWPWRPVLQCERRAAAALLRPKITRRTNAGAGVAPATLSPARGGPTPEEGMRVRRRNTMKVKVAALVLGLAAAGVLLAPVAGFVSLG